MRLYTDEALGSLVPPGILELHCLQNIPQCAGFEACLPLGMLMGHQVVELIPIKGSR
jgi:hypothetical protein